MGNAQEFFYFMSVELGWDVNSLHETALPMPDDVIKNITRLLGGKRGILGWSLQTGIWR